MECALTNSFNEHFLYGSYYFSVYKRYSHDVKQRPGWLHKFSAQGRRITNLTANLDKVTVGV